MTTGIGQRLPRTFRRATNERSFLLHLSPTGSGVVLPFPLPNTAASRRPPDVTRAPPAIPVALPDGGQAQLPGVLWPNPAV